MQYMSGSLGYERALTFYLYDRYNGLKAFRDQNGNAADAILRDLSYNNGQDQNYRDEHIQELYSLRYMYAYGYEYLEMYLRLMGSQKLPSMLNILSIGCGNGIDYWSVQSAKKITRSLNLDDNKTSFVKYTGLDVVQWNWRWGEDRLSRLHASVQYPAQGEAVQYLQANPVLEYNVIVFPKSISEFEAEDFQKMCDAFARAKFQYQRKDGQIFLTSKVHFLISLRRMSPDDPGNAEDIQRTEDLIKAMEQSGFAVEDENSAAVFCGPSDPDVYLDAFFNGISRYPNAIRNDMIELNQLQISRQPILKAWHLCNRVITFVRKDRQ